MTQYSDTCTDTLALTDAILDAPIEKPNYYQFLGSINGKIYTYSGSYKSDDSTIATCKYHTKSLDFADIYEDCYDKWKTVYFVKLIYMDLSADTDVTVYISADGGETWNWMTKTLGNGDGTTKSAEYYFIKTGKHFCFKVEHASDDKEFCWVGLEVYFETAGEWFEV